MVAGGVQRVGGHHLLGQFEACQEGLELGDLTVADRHESLPHNRSVLVGERGQQMHPGAAGAPDRAP